MHIKENWLACQRKPYLKISQSTEDSVLKADFLFNPLSQLSRGQGKQKDMGILRRFTELEIRAMFTLAPWAAHF